MCIHVGSSIEVQKDALSIYESELARKIKKQKTDEAPEIVEKNNLKNMRECRKAPKDLELIMTKRIVNSDSAIRNPDVVPQYAEAYFVRQTGRADFALAEVSYYGTWPKKFKIEVTDMTKSHRIY